MGADEALHVVCEDRLGPEATATALKAALEGREYDLILCGKQASDEDDAAVGPMVAAMLGLPCVAFVHNLTLEDGKAIAEREVDGETEILEVDLPAIFTAQKGLAEPRYPGLKGIMAAKRKPLTNIDLVSGEDHVELLSLELPAARGDMVSIEPTPDGMRTLLEGLRAEKKVL